MIDVNYEKTRFDHIPQLLQSIANHTEEIRSSKYRSMDTPYINPAKHSLFALIAEI